MGKATASLPSKAAIAGHWIEIWKSAKDCLMPWGYWADPYEPECMACRKYSESWYDGVDTWTKAWNKASLDRCHIVPAQHQGRSDDASNFVLMCRRCHEDSPDTTLPNVLFDWMKQRPKLILGRFSPSYVDAASSWAKELFGKSKDSEVSLEHISSALQTAGERLAPGSHCGIGFSEGTHLALLNEARKILMNLTTNGNDPAEKDETA